MPLQSYRVEALVVKHEFAPFFVARATQDTVLVDGNAKGPKLTGPSIKVLNERKRRASARLSPAEQNREILSPFGIATLCLTVLVYAVTGAGCDTVGGTSANTHPAQARHTDRSPGTVRATCGSIRKPAAGNAEGSTPGPTSPLPPGREAVGISRAGVLMYPE